MAQYNSFIVRIWRSMGANGPQWAGQVEHIQRAATVRFTNIEDLQAYLHAAGSAVEMPAGTALAAVTTRADGQA